LRYFPFFKENCDEEVEINVVLANKEGFERKSRRSGKDLSKI